MKRTTSLFSAFVLVIGFLCAREDTEVANDNNILVLARS